MLHMYLFHCTVPHPLVGMWLEAHWANGVLLIAVLAGEVSRLALVHLSKYGKDLFDLRL